MKSATDEELRQTEHEALDHEPAVETPEKVRRALYNKGIDDTVKKLVAKLNELNSEGVVDTMSAARIITAIRK